MSFFNPLLLLLLSSFSLFSYQLTCLNHNGASVPWYFMIKYPNKTVVKAGETHTHVYFDSDMSASRQSNFELRTNYLDQKGEALFETFNQANINSKYQVIAWNDEPALATEELLEPTFDGYTYTHTAHSKGVIIYDGSTHTGIYLPHSTPKYPAIDSNGVINITVASSQRIYGQNYLCMSLDQANLEKVAEGLLITGVTVYYNSFKDSSSVNLYKLGQNTPASNSGDQSKVIEFSLGRLPVVGFFKNPYFDTGFIFENVMVPYLQDSLMIESWGRPYQSPTCGIMNGLEVDNIEGIKLRNDDEGSWACQDDHSKWGITKIKKFVCSGGMNRMTSQASRGGSFFCFQDETFWNVLNGIITSVNSCSGKSFLE